MRTRDRQADARECIDRHGFSLAEQFHCLDTVIARKYSALNRFIRSTLYDIEINKMKIFFLRFQNRINNHGLMPEVSTERLRRKSSTGIRSLRKQNSSCCTVLQGFITTVVRRFRPYMDRHNYCKSESEVDERRSTRYNRMIYTVPTPGLTSESRTIYFL